ncbi:hypothetical protein B0H16DRAFT_1468859 [Mycena metata]|uniref:Uncharacterized protein n=1 Tax=Mycena metata TaxID=1033252 RepID=A0AAD7HZU9_9AGAR|nr:hypothetical protein B0H16DRAFT_1468859 [Mycena metata]
MRAYRMGRGAGQRKPILRREQGSTIPQGHAVRYGLGEGKGAGEWWWGEREREGAGRGEGAESGQAEREGMSRACAARNPTRVPTHAGTRLDANGARRCTRTRCTRGARTAPWARRANASPPSIEPAQNGADAPTGRVLRLHEGGDGEEIGNKGSGAREGGTALTVFLARSVHGATSGLCGCTRKKYCTATNRKPRKGRGKNAKAKAQNKRRTPSDEANFNIPGRWQETGRWKDVAAGGAAVAR